MADEGRAGDRADTEPQHDTVPRGVWVLGFVSLLMDTSSEMIHSLLPIFLTSVLGVGALWVGIIEGIAEATAAITKVFSGALSDRVGWRKPLVLAGYGLAALSKPVFAVAPSVGWVMAARFTDRVGKGIRGAPRDALVTDLTPDPVRGAAFGLRQSLDTAGAVAGPLIALAIMWLADESFRLVFWVATVPAVLAVLMIVLAVPDSSAPRGLDAASSGLSWRRLADFPAAFWMVVGIAMLLALARFSEGFLLLRAQSMGLAAAFVPLVFVIMNAVYAAICYPVGAWSDRIGRHGLLFGGFAVLITADLVLAWATSVWQVLVGVALWGIHMGMTQGLLSTLVADTAPSSLRGTAFGIFNLLSGVALLAASLIAG